MGAERRKNQLGEGETRLFSFPLFSTTTPPKLYYLQYPFPLQTLSDPTLIHGDKVGQGMMKEGQCEGVGREEGIRVLGSGEEG